MSGLSKLHNWLKVEETEEMKESKGHLWTNADLAPNPPETRKWDSWSFFLFQVNDARMRVDLILQTDMSSSRSRSHLRRITRVRR